MNSFEIVRSWKDEDYRFGLIAEPLTPDNPAGPVALGDEELNDAVGANNSLNSVVMLPPIVLFPLTAPVICLFPR
jgi:mersacidin/lichenicidin family type 2 lantibiotic